MSNSVFGSLSLSKDGLKALFVTVVTAFLTSVVKALEESRFPTLAEFKVALIVGVTAGVAYIIKNLVTNSDGELMTPERK